MYMNVGDLGYKGVRFNQAEAITPVIIEVLNKLKCTESLFVFVVFGYVLDGVCVHCDVY